MGTVYTTTIPSADQPLDGPQVAETLRPYVEVLSGGLNEHNFTVGALDATDRGKILPGAALHTDVSRGNASGVYDSAAGTYEPDASGLGIVEIPHTGKWYEVIGEDITIRRTGVLTIFASAAVCTDRWAGATVLSQTFGGQFAIAVDGVPYVEGALGCFDRSNERFDRQAGAPQRHGSYGLLRYAASVRFMQSVPVTEGSHRVSLMCRSVGTDLGSPLRAYERQVIPLQLLGGRGPIG